VLGALHSNQRERMMVCRQLTAQWGSVMNQRSVASVAMVFGLGLGLFPCIAASQGTLKEAVVGSWSLVSAIDQYEDGKKINNWGAVKGRITFDGAGRFSQIIIGEAQPAMKTADPRKPDAPVVAYFGTYTVDDATKTLSLKLDAASYSARTGTPSTSSIVIKGDTMTLASSPRKDQRGTFRPQLELKRSK
jgi:hypothetical protein